VPAPPTTSGYSGGNEAVPALLGTLRSKKTIDRRAAALALGKIGAMEALAGLHHALKDRDAVVQRFAFEALETITPMARMAA
jgi:HEAT repeat protein